MSKRYAAFGSAYHARAISCLGYYACQECISSEQQHHYMYLLLPSWCLLDPEYSIRSIGGQRTLYQNLSSYQAYMFCHSNRAVFVTIIQKVLFQQLACFFYQPCYSSVKLRFTHFFVINTTVSTCIVCGNISTGCTFSIMKPFSRNNAASLAKVAGSQET